MKGKGGGGTDTLIWDVKGTCDVSMANRGLFVRSFSTEAPRVPNLIDAMLFLYYLILSVLKLETKDESAELQQCRITIHRFLNSGNVLLPNIILFMVQHVYRLRKSLSLFIFIMIRTTFQDVKRTNLYCRNFIVT
jgi:hypothetical protein